MNMNYNELSRDSLIEYFVTHKDDMYRARTNYDCPVFHYLKDVFDCEHTVYYTFVEHPIAFDAFVNDEAVPEAYCLPVWLSDVLLKLAWDEPYYDAKYVTGEAVLIELLALDLTTNINKLK